jgi:hypothetical protein
MKLFPIRNVGEVSLNTDLVPWELSPNFITYGKNFRALNKNLFAYQTNTPVLPVDSSGYAGNRLIATTSAGTNYILAMGKAAVKVFNYVNWTDISSAQGYGSIPLNTESQWTSTLLGSIPVISHPFHGIEYWSPQNVVQKLRALQFSPPNTVTSGSFVVGKQYTIKTLGTTDFTLIGASANTVGVTFTATGTGLGTGTATDIISNTWFDKGYRCKVIRAHKQFLFALGLIEGSTELNNSYRWSHPADINGLPFTWDETDLSAIAGKDSIGADSGDIIDGATTGDSFSIYSERGIVALDFIGNEFVWRKRQISTIAGLLSKDCVVEVEGNNFFISNGDIIRNDGRSLTSLMNNRLRKDFAALIDTNNFRNSYAVKLKHENEVWFCVPISGSTYPNIAYVYNWIDDTWSVKDLPANISHSVYSKISPNVDTWESSVGTWDTDPDIWVGTGDSPFLSGIVGVNPTAGSALFDLFSNVYVDPINAVIERTGLVFNDSDVTVSTITRVYPHMQGAGTVLIEIGSHDYVNSGVRWKPAILFNIGTDRKIDVRSTGELHAYRLTSVGDNSFTFNGLTFEYEDNGVR